MGFAVELLFDVRKGGAWWSHLDTGRGIVEEYGCEMQYFTREIEGKGPYYEESLLTIDSS